MPDDTRRSEPGQTHSRERQFHDLWAGSTRLEDIRIREAFEAPTALENRFILRQMGPLRDRRILDVGAGLGESSVYFALQGALVTATDLSPGMVDTAVRLGESYGVSVEAVLSPAEELCVPSDTFDMVYCANTLHHVPDKEGLFREMRRVLKKGGRFFTMDPLGYNPVIEVYRHMANQVRTQDEAPLTFAITKLADRYFDDVQHREFWIAGLSLFLKYYFVDGIHPNQDRYWKRIYRETNKSLWWWLPLRSIDTVLCRIPMLRAMAWNMVMSGTKR